jgi:hypothetical protein
MGQNFGLWTLAETCSKSAGCFVNMPNADQDGASVRERSHEITGLIVPGHQHVVKQQYAQTAEAVRNLAF